MEQQQQQQQGSPSSSSPSPGSRWNPTREQIAVLESLYKQGIRTPTAEQIHQVTARLRELGAAEGKNVFYWFQNHKARHRHRLKHDNRYAFYNRGFLNRPGPPAPIPGPAVNADGLHCVHGYCNNAVCGSYCMPVPQAGIGFYQAQFPSPRGFIPRPMQMSPTDHQADQFQIMEPYNVNVNNAAGDSDIQTLKLFPLHPTGILEAEKSGSSFTSANSMDNSDDHSVEEGMEGSENNNNIPPFNFFG